MNWNLKLIYESLDDYEKDFNTLDDLKVKLVSLKGKLNEEESFKEYFKL